jgi:hypothetical protein
MILEKNSLSKSHRKKKIWKKAFSGEINTSIQYEECLQYRIKAQTTVAHIHDNTRTVSNFDVTVEELQSLILYFVRINETQSPRGFDVTNRPFVRKIIVLHISDCDNFDFFTGLN